MDTIEPFELIELDPNITGIERAKIIAASMNRDGMAVFVQWNQQGIPYCPICHEKIDKKGECPCGVNKRPDPSLDGYIQCCNTDVKSFREEAERAKKRYEERKRREAELAAQKNK